MTPDDVSDRGPARYPDGRFGPGNPGRPPGSKNRSISDRLAALILADLEASPEGILAQLRHKSPTAFIQLCAQLLPKNVPFAAEAAAVDSGESTAKNGDPG